MIGKFSCSKYYGTAGHFYAAKTISWDFFVARVGVKMVEL